MKPFKSFLLVGATFAGAATSPAVMAQTYPAPFVTQSYESDAKIADAVQSPPAPLSLADNTFAIDAPGIPETVALNGGTTLPTPSGTDIYGNPTYTRGTGYNVFDGDNALHGTGTTSIRNTIVRVMNCLGTPNLQGQGQAVSTGTAPIGGFFATINGLSYNGATLPMACNNGTWVTQSTAATAPTNGIFYGYGANDQTLVTYFIPGANIFEMQPQFSDYSNITGNLSPYGFSGKYVASGQDLALNAWAYGTDVFDDGYGYTTGQPGALHNVPNPFVSIAGQNAWSHVQFSVSDAVLPATGDHSLATYYANAGTRGGPAIAFPLFVIPIALAYNTVYAKSPTKTMTFNTKGSITYSTGKVSALQLSASVYCGIFNGMITNWNDPALTRANNNTPLYDTITDSLTRWVIEGAPIRLAGRIDNSGATDILTRHLAQVCSQPAIYGSSTATGSNYYSASGVTTPLLPAVDQKYFVPNKYLQHAQSLPYAPSSGIDFTSIRSDTNFYPGDTAASNFAGTVNTISGDYYSAGHIINIADTSHQGPHLSATPAKWNGSGLFIMANGGGELAQLLNMAPDYDPTTTGANETFSGLRFNGKIGYFPADFINGADAVAAPTSGTLHAAVLATLPNSAVAVAGAYYHYTYAGPTVKNALAAFNTQGGTLAFLPPETDTSGNFVPTTTSTTSLSGGQIVRSNPLAWTDQLYQSTTMYGSGLVAGRYTLAQPSQGYPIVGTSQMLTYTCFSTAGNREAMATMIAALTGTLATDSTHSKINKSSFTNASVAAPGIVPSSNFGIVPQAWQLAIARTFLSGTSDVNIASTGGGSANTGYAGAPLYFTSAVAPIKVKVSAGVFTYVPAGNNTAYCNSEGNTATLSSVAARTNTGM